MHTYMHSSIVPAPLGGRKECSDRKVWQGSVNEPILNSLAAHRLLAQTRYHHLRYVQRRTLALRPALSHTHYIHTYIHIHTHAHIYILKIIKYLHTYYF